MPSIDFSQVKGLEPVPIDTYLATIVSAEEGVSKADNPKIDLQWKIEEGPFTGRIIFDTLTFHPKAMFRVKLTLSALGWPKNFAGSIEGDDLLGKSAMIVVDVEASTALDDDGEPYPPRNKVKKVKPIVSAAATSRRGRR